MRKILFTVSLLLCSLFATMAQEDSYKIEGRLANTVNGKLLLVADTEQGMIDIGEATVTNGIFEFTGRMPEMTVVYLTPVKKTPVLATIMLENAHYTNSQRLSEKYQKRAIAMKTGASISTHPNRLLIGRPHLASKNIPYPAFTK